MKMWILISLFLPVIAWADASLVITISRSNKLGMKLSDQLKIQDGKYYVNGLVVRKSSEKDAERVIGLFKKMKPSTKKVCGAGTFVLRIKEASKKTETKGCSEGKEYGLLMARLHSLKQKVSVKP
ncbi:hypothetical protein D3C87_102230 [compost metagenome]